MAGGIDWFRWHHGSVTDPKFQLVARQAGASLPDVLAVWAYLLERASAAQDRGDVGDIDCEAVDCMFGFPSTETRTADILAAMAKRGLLAGARITAWEKRQPKREREDDTAAGRQRAKRARDAADQSRSHDTIPAHVTPCHATSHQKTPRGEESREEKREEIQPAPSVRRTRAGERDHSEPSEPPTAAGAICRALRTVGIANVNPGHPMLGTLIDAGATEAEFVGAAAESLDKHDPFAYLLSVVKGQREDAAKAAEGLHRGQMPAAETAYQRSMRERMEQVAPSIAAKRPGGATNPNPMEILDGLTRLAG